MNTKNMLNGRTLENFGRSHLCQVKLGNYFFRKKMQLQPHNSNSDFLEPLSVGEQAVAPGFACVVGNLVNFAEHFTCLYFSWEITLLV